MRPLAASPTTVARARARGGARSGTSPVAVRVELAHGGTLDQVQVRLVADLHPGLADAAVRCGARPVARGFTLQLDGGDLPGILAVLPAASVVPWQRLRTAAGRAKVAEVPRSTVAGEVREVLAAHHAWTACASSSAAALGRRVRTNAAGGLLAVQLDGSRLRFEAGLLEPVRHEGDELWLGVWGPHPRSATMTLPEGLEWMERCARAGLCVVDGSGGEVLELARQLDRAVLVTPLRGAPGLAVLNVGRRSADRSVVGVDTHEVPRDGRPVLVSPEVRDVAAMASAQAQGRAGLRDYQDLFVSRYLSTQHGVVNALAPGMGKTVCAAAALRERHGGRRSRSLAVVPAPLREQWSAELAAHHRGAEVLAVASGADLVRLASAWGTDGPLVVVVSYDLARTHVEELAGLHWDDLVVDEAALLRRRSGRSDALWRLRAAADRAMTLTGTPVERSVEDLAPLVAFSRGDAAMFHGVPLASRSHHGLSRVLGPVVSGSAQDPSTAGLPRLDWRTEWSEPSEGEAAVHAYWVARLREALDGPGGLAGASAVSRAFNACRAVACDPAALGDRQVPEHLAHGLAGRNGGMWQDGVPAKREAACRLVAGHGGQSLVFTDFAGAAHALAAELERRGVDCAAYTSKVTPARRRRAVEAFQSGELSTLVLSGLARQGLNLQRADLVVHYDVPQTPSSVTQRVGRAARIGSPHPAVEVVTLVSRGTVEVPLVRTVEEMSRGGDWLELAARSVAPLRATAVRCAHDLEAGASGS